MKLDPFMCGMAAFIIFVIGGAIGSITSAPSKTETRNLVVQNLSQLVTEGRVICVDSDAYLSFKEKDYSVNIPLFGKDGNRLQCNQVNNVESK